MNHWIQYKFRFNDDPDSPDWWMDLFLIDTAFRDIIEKHKPELWRFHRRSGKDSVGHQLSLLVYTDKKISEKIHSELSNHNAVAILANDIHPKIKSFIYEEMEPGIEKTSDVNWTMSLQKSWPYFACGACQMILGLFPDPPEYWDNQKKIFFTSQHYEGVDKVPMKEFFSDNASHAFIHHLSALFGYAPINLRI